MSLKPAPPKARLLFKKLQALAEAGLDGEKMAAQEKLDRLKARFDFSGLDEAGLPDMFAGSFRRSSTARPIYTFASHELDVANSVKWAIESATRIKCSFRNDQLLAETNERSATRLAQIAVQIAESFRALIDQFSHLDGVSRSDRGLFVRGLYDGMMNESRAIGQKLPNRAGATTKKRNQKKAPAESSLNVHPYTLAVTLGKRIRFSVPLAQITAELEAATRKHLSASAGQA